MMSRSLIISEDQVGIFFFFLFVFFNADKLLQHRTSQNAHSNQFSITWFQDVALLNKYGLV